MKTAEMETYESDVTRSAVDLLNDVFGMKPNIHKYLVCEECGREYYEFRPRYCDSCGYAGGAIVAQYLPLVAATMQKRLGVSVYKSEMKKIKLGRNPLNRAAEIVKQSHDEYKKNPRGMGLLLCKLYEMGLTG